VCRRELGFEGVPYRETVMVLPTVNCLVELTQMPFTVVSLADIEIVNLERVGFNLKNFDMAIVFKVGPDGPFRSVLEGEWGIGYVLCL
jgi:nucleosome binding factor SPN SPT16 subunit